ncbi:MAG: DUF962 domain-containing protein [Pararobbsia sp.]
MQPTLHSDHFASFSEFYPYYLSEHRNAACRRLHFVGSARRDRFRRACAGDRRLDMADCRARLRLCVRVDRALFFEHNRPATFRHPLYSLMGDWVMFKDICTGRIVL